MTDPLAYCGPPPTPETLAGAWQTDPLLLAALAFALPALWRTVPAIRRGWAAAGWVVATVALVSPLCALSVALASARSGQHMMLALVAAPLIAAALGPTRVPVGRAAIGFGVAVWLWQVPAFYDLTFTSDIAYWAMHLTVTGASVLLWQGLLAPRPVQALVAAGVTAIHTAFLGGLIAFAPRVLYAPHLGTSFAFGLDPLEVQQLAGLILWVPGGLLFVGAAALYLARIVAPKRAGGGAP